MVAINALAIHAIAPVMKADLFILGSARISGLAIERVTSEKKNARHSGERFIFSAERQCRAARGSLKLASIAL